MKAGMLLLAAALSVPAQAGFWERMSWPVLAPEDLKAGTYHARHAEIFGKYAAGYNIEVLRAVDAVQKTAMDGGGYFTGVKAVPPESPIGYPVALFGKPLLDPPRKTSYCSGSSYTALIEALNRIFPNGLDLAPERAESLRMQEPDGGRREDFVKFWGNWNADDFGNHYALIQYSDMGTVIPPAEARAGDFLNIHWKTGVSHSVVFLGWHMDKKAGKSVLFWSSQAATNGLADRSAPLSLIDAVKIVRLTHPQGVATFDVNKPVSKDVAWDKVAWAWFKPSRRAARAP